MNVNLLSDKDVVDPAKATKANLANYIGGKDTPALLFTASHGMNFKVDDPRQLRHQGALLCQEREHIRRGHLRRLLADHLEEHLQVIRRRQPRVHRATRANELQIGVDQRMAERDRSKLRPIHHALHPRHEPHRKAPPSRRQDEAERSTPRRTARTR